MEKNQKTMNIEKTIAINIPEGYRVMSDYEFLKAKGLVWAALDIVSEKMDDDDTADLLWPILQCAHDIFVEYKDTADLLYNVNRVDAIEVKRVNLP